MLVAEKTEQKTDNAVSMSTFAKTQYEQKYAMKDDAGKVIEEWPDTAERVTRYVLGALGYGPGDKEFEAIKQLITDRKFLPGGRYLYSSGRPLHQVNNCILLRAEDSREGWAELLYKSTMALQTGAGIGVDYSDVRPSGSVIRKTGGTASGPLSLMKMINEVGRNVMQGGSRRSAIWAGLNWKHDDVMDFIMSKNWSKEVRKLKEDDFNFPATLDMTNISILLDDEFFKAISDEDHAYHGRATAVYDLGMRRMLKTAEPGFSVDAGKNKGETLRNACTEVTSSDDSDICNLGSINLARIQTKEEFAEVVDYATLFLLAGTVYSDIPYDKISQVREKNRRLGLGVMGVHDWLLQRGYRYEPTDELAEWMRVYEQTDRFADNWCEKHNLSKPVKTRAIAPTGTIGIVAETTTGIEPIYCVAYKRRYLADGQTWKFQYVVDPTAQKNITQFNRDPLDVEDAYTLAYDPERRVAFQAWMQQFVDHGISSTINLPAPVTDEKEIQDYKEMLLKYLPQLRGITCYPDGARGGQPLTVASYQTAIENEGVVFEEDDERCVGGVCGV